MSMISYHVMKRKLTCSQQDFGGRASWGATFGGYAVRPQASIDCFLGT